MKKIFTKVETEILLVFYLTKKYFQRFFWQKKEDLYCLQEYEKKEVDFNNENYWQEFSSQISFSICPKISIVLGSELGFFYGETISNLPEKEVISYSQEKIKRDYKINFDWFYHDYHLRPSIKKNLMEIIWAGVSKELLERILKIVNEKEIELVNLSLFPLSLFIFLQQTELPKDKVIAILYIDDEKSWIYILDNKRLLFYHQLSFSRQKIINCLLRTIYTEKGAVEIDAQKAEELVRKHGYPYHDGRAEIMDYHQLRYLLSPPLEMLKDEVREAITSYSQGYLGERISILYLLGWSAKFKYLDNYLESKLGIKTIPFKIEENFPKFIIDLKKEENVEINEIFPSLPALIEEKTRISQLLLPPEYKMKKKVKKMGKIWGLITLGIISLILLFYVFVNINIAYYQRLLNRAKGTLSQLKRNEQKVLKVKKEEKKILEIVKNINGIISGKPDWIGVMKAISNITPQEIILDALQKKEDSLLIRGHIFSEEGYPDIIITNYIRSLDKSPYFQNIELKIGSKAGYGSIASYNFEIKCRLSY